VPDAWEDWKRNRLARTEEARKRLFDDRLWALGLEHRPEDTRIPCMWCGELFLPDLVDEHEDACG
jgi:hypothetical protein